MKEIIKSVPDGGSVNMEICRHDDGKTIEVLLTRHFKGGSRLNTFEQVTGFQPVPRKSLVFPEVARRFARRSAPGSRAARNRTRKQEKPLVFLFLSGDFLETASRKNAKPLDCKEQTSADSGAPGPLRPPRALRGPRAAGTAPFCQKSAAMASVSSVADHPAIRRLPEATARAQNLRAPVTLTAKGIAMHAILPGIDQFRQAVEQAFELDIGKPAFEQRELHRFAMPQQQPVNPAPSFRIGHIVGDQPESPVHGMKAL